MSSEATKVIERVHGRLKVFTSNLDKSLTEGNVADKGIGIPYIMQARESGNYGLVVNGAIGYLQVKYAVWKNPELDHTVDGLEIFYSKLKKAHIGREDEMVQMAQNYITTHSLRSTVEIMQDFPSRFLVTSNGSSVAQAAVRTYKMVNFISNEDIFGEDGLISGVKVNIRDGEDKVKGLHDMLKGFSIELKDCVYVGDSKVDVPVMQLVGFPIASPFATDEVKGYAHFILTDKSLINPQELIRR